MLEGVSIKSRAVNVPQRFSTSTIPQSQNSIKLNRKEENGSLTNAYKSSNSNSKQLPLDLLQLPRVLSNRIPVITKNCSCFEKYIIICNIGSGTYANVWKVKSVVTGEILAAKLLQPQKFSLETQARVVQMFKSEIENLAICQCPGVVRLHEVVYGHEGWLIIQEFIDGGTVWKENLCQTKEESFLLFIQLLQSVYFLQEKKIVHRDLKPTNILCTKLKKMVIADFGWSEKLCDCQLHPMEWPGTLEVNPPEVINFSGPLTEKLDNYAVGMNLMLFISGKFTCRPKGLNVAAAAPHVQRAVYQLRNSHPPRGFRDQLESWDIFLGLTAPEPSHRWSLKDVFEHPWVLKNLKTIAKKAPHFLWHEKIRSLAFALSPHYTSFELKKPLEAYKAIGLAYSHSKDTETRNEHKINKKSSQSDNSAYISGSSLNGIDAYGNDPKIVTRRSRKSASMITHGTLNIVQKESSPLEESIKGKNFTPENLTKLFAPQKKREPSLSNNILNEIRNEPIEEKGSHVSNKAKVKNTNFISKQLIKNLSSSTNIAALLSPRINYRNVIRQYKKESYQCINHAQSSSNFTKKDTNDISINQIFNKECFEYKQPGTRVENLKILKYLGDSSNSNIDFYRNILHNLKGENSNFLKIQSNNSNGKLNFDELIKEIYKDSNNNGHKIDNKSNLKLVKLTEKSDTSTTIDSRQTVTTKSSYEDEFLNIGKASKPQGALSHDDTKNFFSEYSNSDYSRMYRFKSNKSEMSSVGLDINSLMKDTHKWSNIVEFQSKIRSKHGKEAVFYKNIEELVNRRPPVRLSIP